MRPTFYKFAMRYRDQEGPYGQFVEAMRTDGQFPRDEKDFDTLSRYIESSADVRYVAHVFDEMYEIYDDRLARSWS